MAGGTVRSIVGLGAAAALAACTPTEPTAAPPENDAAAAVAAGQEPPVLVAVNRGRTTLSPAAINLGRFTVEGGCLRFITGERSYLAVFGSGAGAGPTVAGGSLILSGRKLDLGKDYQIGGGSSALEPGVFELAPEIERACPGPYFQVGPILER